MTHGDPPDPAREMPVRLVVDTNLWVASLFRPQAKGPRELLEAWERGEVVVAVSEDMLREVRATLGRLPVESRRKNAILDRLKDPNATFVTTEVPDSGYRCRDPQDDKFLHLAIASGAQALITSDRALLELTHFPVPIVKSGQWRMVVRR